MEKGIKVMVGSKEFELSQLQLHVLASNLAANAGLELELPDEMGEDEGGGAS